MIIPEIQGQPSSLSEVLELLLGVGLDRAQASAPMGNLLQGQRTGKAGGPPSSHTQGPRAIKALQEEVGSTTQSWRPCRASARCWTPSLRRLKGALIETTPWRQSHRRSWILPQLSGRTGCSTSRSTPSQCSSRIRTRGYKDCLREGKSQRC